MAPGADGAREVALEVDDAHRITGYRLRIDDGKRRAVNALRELNFHVVATGDSYNDTSMLGAANGGILYRPPQNVIDEFPQFPVATNYEELKAAFLKLSDGSMQP